MPDKYQNKYRIKSARLAHWDYSWSGSYFVTICTKDRECFFGKVIKDKMKFSDVGVIADHFFREIPIHFPIVRIDAFVVMPNHVHGIVIIDNPNDDLNQDGDGGGHGGRDAINRVSTTTKKTVSGGITGDHNPMLHNNLSRILRWYKGRVSYEIHKTNPYFAWQPRFHDHIIRNERSYDNIRRYIIDNPKKWKNDEFNPGI